MIYDAVKIMINEEFEEYLQRTMQFIEKLIMNMHFMKVERWHSFTKIVKAFNNQLMVKDLDCYNFNPQQF